MDIRLASEYDLSALFQIDHIARGNLEKRREFLSGTVDRSECYVASIEEELIGYAVFNYTFFRNGTINMLYIKEEFRGRGIGGQLIDYIERLCPEEKLFTSTNQSNLRMRRLMEKKGFEKSGVIENLDEGDPEIVYLKRLNTEEQDRGGNGSCRATPHRSIGK
ncbi:MAG: GNAT family N-acetyltransferase [Verrucomicrobiota bacterium]